MASSKLAVALACCALAAAPLVAGRALQQAPAAPRPIVSGGPFGSTPASDLTAQLALGGNAVSQSMAGSLKVANLAETAFSLLPCTFFQTHIHPNATEVITAIEGQIQACTLLNGALDCSTLTPGTAFTFPQGHVHFFFNPQCKQAVAISVLNSNTPGLAIYDSAKFPGLISGKPTQGHVESLIAAQTPITTPPGTNFQPSQLFVPLLNCGCGAGGATADAGAAAGR